MNWEEIKNLGSKRTPGDWRFKTYKPGGAPEYEDQFYDWWIDDGEIRICSHEATNHRNGKFIVELVNAWPKIERVVEAAIKMYEIRGTLQAIVALPGSPLANLRDALKDLGAVE